MKKQIFRAVSLIIAVCVAAGCNGTAEETTTTTAAEIAEETEVSEQAIEPMPEGWSVEKIAALIEIDGNSLKFPCTPEEFESLSEKITLSEPDEIFNYCDIYYDDVNIGTFALNHNSGYCDTIHFDINNFYDTNIVNSITFCGYKIDDAQNINSSLDNDFKYYDVFTVDSGLCFKNYLWNIKQERFSLALVFSEAKTESISFALRKEED